MFPSEKELWEAIQDGPYVRMFTIFWPIDIKNVLEVLSGRETSYELFTTYKTTNCTLSINDKWTLDIDSVGVLPHSDWGPRTETFVVNAIAETDDIAAEFRKFLKDQPSLPDCNARIKFIRKDSEYLYIPKVYLEEKHQEYLRG